MKRIKNISSANNLEKPTYLDPTSRNFVYDEVDDFHDKDDLDNSDDFSDDCRKEQVLGLQGINSDDDDDDDDDDQSEDEDHDNDDLMKNDIHSAAESDDYDDDDERRLGNKKKHYYGTDLSDKRIHNLYKVKNKRRKDSGLQLELEGVRKLQDRMRKEMSDGFYFGQLFANSGAKEEKLPDKIRESEFKDSDSPLKKESAETSPILLDMKEKTRELSEVLAPLMELKKKGVLAEASSSLLEYLQTRYFLCLNYLSAVAAYMMLKEAGAETSDHPAETRLLQYKQLFLELEPCKRKYDREVTALLNDLKGGKFNVKEGSKGKRRTLLGVVKATKILKKAPPSDEKSQVNQHSDNEEANQKEILNENDQIDNEGGDKVLEQEVGEEAGDDDRRLINLKIAKNKGLTRFRKKEFRNPRVRYKNKYHKKLIRRKGQVRTVRKEIAKYDGEIAGIKSNLIKSIKLK